MRRSGTVSKLLVATGIVLLMFVGMKKNGRAVDFDPNYYAAKYPDVVAAYGTDSSALYSHYLTFGMKEKRFKNAQEEKAAFTGQSVAGGQEAVNTATYVDVDIANQQMIFYKDGVPTLISPVVTGNVNRGNGTPTGVFFIDTKVPGKYLNGPTWHVWVDRWMKFTGCVGLHDASWRSQFGGDIYTKDGSHGCVNLPCDVAKTLYDMVDIGTMVVVH